MKKTVILLLFAVIILAGCTTRMVDFTIISTKNVDLSRAAEFESGKSRITGEDMAHIIVFIPTGQINIKEAIDNALESVPGAVALLDGVISSKFFYIPYIYGQQSYIVEGTALIDPQLASNSDNSLGEYNVVRLDSNGDLESIEIVTKDVYENYKR